MTRRIPRRRSRHHGAETTSRGAKCCSSCSTTSVRGILGLRGVIDTPNADRLAAKGVKLNRFHTTALCAPPLSPLTGRNHTPWAWGRFLKSPPRPGLQLHPAQVHRPHRSDSQAERVLHRPVRQVSRGAGLEDEPMGRSSSGHRSGFDYFYGFLGGETNQYYPASSRAPSPSSRPAPPRRATTSPRT